MNEDDIQRFLEDDKTTDISPQIFGPKCSLLAMSNGEIVRLYDLYGWEEYYLLAPLLELVKHKGKIPSLDKIWWTNELDEIEVEDQ